MDPNPAALPAGEPELPLVLVDDEASGVVARAREIAARPDLTALMMTGRTGSGKTNALAATRAQLDAAGVPYEVTDTGRGTVTLTTRPVSRPTEEPRP
ncbi:hypothetical protein ACWDR0_23775 [Streptomyces sp. NPDC003691]